jgi:hypothetical protein
VIVHIPSPEGRVPIVAAHISTFKRAEPARGDNTGLAGAAGQREPRAGISLDFPAPGCDNQRHVAPGEIVRSAFDTTVCRTGVSEVWRGVAISALLGGVQLLIGATAFGLTSQRFCAGSDMLIAAASVIGSLLALRALTRPPEAGKARGNERFIGAGLLLYVVAAVVTEQFMWIGSNPQAPMQAIAWLLPLLLGGMVLPRLGYWLTSASCWMILFAGYGAASYSA